MKKEKPGFASASGLLSEEGRAGAQQISDILDGLSTGKGTSLAWTSTFMVGAAGLALEGTLYEEDDLRACGRCHFGGRHLERSDDCGRSLLWLRSRCRCRCRRDRRRHHRWCDRQQCRGLPGIRSGPG